MSKVVAYPRLHLGLLDCGLSTSRRFGGLGFAVQGLPLTVSVRTDKSANSRPRLTGLFESLDESARRDVEAVLCRLSQDVALPGLTLTLESVPPQHVGLGSKTTLLLATVRGACAAAGIHMTPAAMQRISGRGGASGVGLTTFFRGGFVVDAGHPRTDGHGLRPSGAIHSGRVPTVSVRSAMPREWVVTLALANANGLSGAAEVNFFEEHTPIADKDVRRAITLAYHEVVPAVLERDLAALGRGLTLLQSVGFKRHEIEAQEDATRDLLDGLQSMAGVAAGMSSMGPMVFAIHAAKDIAAASSIVDHVQKLDGEVFGPFPMRNRGYVLHP
ncbi:beta-ribofuranosylaminobenzene 5'-phosphate synthase family protein [Streptomyces albidoflavus]